MGNIIKSCCQSAEKDIHTSEVPISDHKSHNDCQLPLQTEKKEHFSDVSLKHSEASSIKSFTSSSSSSTNSTKKSENIEESCNDIQEEEPCKEDDNQNIQEFDQTNKDESSCLVENDKYSPNFEESSDKDNEEVDEPVTQIAVAVENLKIEGEEEQ